MKLGALLLALAGFSFWIFGEPPTLASNGDRTIVTYFASGQRKSETAYRDGKRHGPHRAWYSDGTPRIDGEFLAGERQGRWSVWTADGAPDRSDSGTFRRGVRVDELETARRTR